MQPTTRGDTVAGVGHYASAPTDTEGITSIARSRTDDVLGAIVNCMTVILGRHKSAPWKNIGIRSRADSLVVGSAVRRGDAELCPPGGLSHARLSIAIGVGVR